MSQQGTATMMAFDTWQDWEGRVVGGRFALGPYLGGSDHSVVYLTDFGGSRAVVKLVGADTADAEAQLARWEAACRLAHPNLLRVFDTGRWHANEEQDMFFAVMEYADENLGEILDDRVLTPVETREMLLPVLDALGHLHANNLVHGDLKPSNLLAVGQELKLAVDGVRRTGSRVTGQEQEDWRAAPEVFKSSVSARNDIWALGLLVVGSLTKQRPVWDRTKEDEVKLPEGLPEPFASIARECLQRDPAKRCSNVQIRRLLERPIETKNPEAQVVPIRPEVGQAGAGKEEKPVSTIRAEEVPAAKATASMPERKEASSHAAVATAQETHARDTRAKDTCVDVAQSYSSPTKSIILDAADTGGRQRSTLTEGDDRKSRFLPFALAILVAIFAITGLVWFFSHRSQETRISSAPVQTTQRSQVSPVTSQPSAAQPDTSLARSSGAVAHQVMPEILRSAQNTIHGVVKVRVEVNVNEAGSVTVAGLAAHGPSRYFAKQALDAAREWTFTPPVLDGRPVASRWMLQFQFRRSGVKAESKIISPRVQAS
jgi:TonB family protein